MHIRLRSYGITFFSSGVAFGKRSGWVLRNRPNQRLLLVYEIGTESGIRMEDGKSERDRLQALAFIRCPDFLGRRTLWDSQQHIVLWKRRSTGHDPQMLFDTKKTLGSVDDTVAGVLRRCSGSKLLPTVMLSSSNVDR